MDRYRGVLNSFGGGRSASAVAPAAPVAQQPAPPAAQATPLAGGAASYGPMIIGVLVALFALAGAYYYVHHHLQQQKQQDTKHQQELEAIEARAAVMREQQEREYIAMQHEMAMQQQQQQQQDSMPNARDYGIAPRMTQFDSTASTKGDGAWRTLGQSPEEAEPSREDTAKAAESYMTRRAEMFAHMNPREQAQRQSDFRQAQDDPNASTI